MRILKRKTAKNPARRTTINSNQQRPRRILLEGLESRWLLSTIPPVIPSGSGHLFVVTSAPYNAVGDGTTDNTSAIQKAINDCSAAGGGTVEIPAAASAYESQPLLMASNVNLQVDSGAVLQAFSKSKLVSAPNGFIYCNNINNFEISGTGTGATQGRIDGNGSTWWPSTSGPNMFKLSGVNQVLIQNVTITNSPHEHIACGNNVNNDVIINGITINTPSTTPNTDGIDPAGTNWLIENCNVSDGDDDIVIKPANQPCANFDIENCTIGYGHGISVGGQTNATLNNMIVNNCNFNGGTMGLRLKGGPANGGAVNNISYSNITMTNVKIPIEIDSWYNGGDNIPSNPATAAPSGTNIPTWNNISYNNVTATWNSSLPSYNASNYSSSIAGELWGLPAAPLTNINFTDVRIGAFNAQEVAPMTGMQIVHARNVTFDSSSSISVVNGNDILSVPANPGANPPTAGFPTPYDDTITEQGFLFTSVGSPTVPTGTSWSLYDPTTGKWTLQGDGAGIAGTSDQADFDLGSVNGDQTIIAKLTSLTGPGGGAVAQAGVIYRAGTSAGDAFAAVVQNTNGQAIFEYRATTNGSVTTVPITLPVGTEYLEVSRSGNTFTGGYGTDGTHFTTIGSIAIAAIPSTAFAGIAGTSNSNGNVAPAIFTNVQIINSPSSNTAPVINSGPAAVLSADGKSIALTVGATDDGGPGNLTYTWTATTVPGGVTSPSFDLNNGTNAGSSETASINGIGKYTFQVTVTDSGSLSTSATVDITVGQVVTTVTVTPTSQTIVENATLQFSAAAFDQFGNALSSPPTFTWSFNGAHQGSIDTNGLYTAPFAATTDQVIATGASVNSTPSDVTVIAATIAGRAFFYNNSTYDGNDPTANASDLNAIDTTTKSALLPGGTATYANLSNYTKGINGIMVDLSNLPQGATLSAGDFKFATGNSNDTTTWTTLATSPTVTMLSGTGGITHADLIWPDGTIANTWLQVTVVANNDTGLAANDVFYFGNLVGEVGNSTTQELVTAQDLVLMQLNTTGKASLQDVYDANRDGRVTAQDVVLAQLNSFINLKLIAPTGNGPAVQLLTVTHAATTASPLIATPIVTTLSSTTGSTTTEISGGNGINNVLLDGSQQKQTGHHHRHKF